MINRGFLYRHSIDRTQYMYINNGRTCAAQHFENCASDQRLPYSFYHIILYTSKKKSLTHNLSPQMMKHAWDGYSRYGWGKNEVRPSSKRGHSASIFGSASMGATIVDAMDTLYIMGFVEEFEKGREWIDKNLDMGHMVRTRVHLCVYLYWSRKTNNFLGTERIFVL